MKNRTKALAVVLSAAMLIGNCGIMAFAGETEASTEAAAAQTREGGSDTLVVGYDPFNQKFSPFFGTTAYDMDVSSMVQVPLLINDRAGQMIMHGIEGETTQYNGTDYTYTGIADCDITENEDGTVDYHFKLRDDI